MLAVAPSPTPIHDESTALADEPIIGVADARQLTGDQRWTWVAYLRSRGALAEVAAWIDQITAISGPSVRAQEERAATLLAADRPAEAVALLRQRAEARPSATASVRLALALIAAGQVDEAVALAADTYRASPELKSVQALRISAARAAQDWDVLARHYAEERTSNPDSAATRLNLAEVALAQGDQDAARHHLDDALRLRAAGEGLPLKQAADLAEALGLTETAAGLDAEFAARSVQSRHQRDVAVQSALLERLGRPVPAEIRPPAASDLPTGWPAAAAPLTSSDRHLAIDPNREAELDLEVAPVEEPHDLRSRHPEVYDLLHRAFSYDDLRPGQAAVIANVLGGRDTIAIMPTGAGKSLTFQIPAMLMEGVTLVLSPLIALMKDQVESLPGEIRERTALVNSTLSLDEQHAVREGIARGRYKLIYAAPERLRQWSFVHAMRQAGTRLVVIDEVHCISMWGHDFRPDYLQIPQVLPALGNPAVLAMTATATRRMSTEIGQALGRELDLLTVNLFRPNLHYAAVPCANREEKVRRALEIAQKERGAGIIYVGSRADADQLANSLRQRGVAAVAYHAGLDRDTREANQNQFMSGRARVVTATVAFGMGVNKSDVRFIVHLAPSRSLESYAQESGRAGRDGQPARCVLLYTAYDGMNLSRQSARDQITIPALRRVYVNLRAAASGSWALIDPRDLLPAGSTDTAGNLIEDDVDPRVALGILAQAGLVVRHPDAPAAFTLQPYTGFDPEAGANGDSDWREYARWTWDGPRVAGGTLATLDACSGLGITPTVLTETLESEPLLGVREGPRQICLELRPADASVRDRMGQVLNRSQAEASRRVAQMIAYADGGRCRHQAIAAHLGQRLDPCGTACDVCTGNRPVRQASRATGRRGATAADALEVLAALPSLPFPMGKTGLTRLLAGSVESSVRDDRSASFGALQDLSTGKIGQLIDQLVDEGFLFRDLNHDFKIITATPKGASATYESLVAAGYPSGKGATYDRRGASRRETARGSRYT